MRISFLQYLKPCYFTAKNPTSALSWTEKWATRRKCKVHYSLHPKLLMRKSLDKVYNNFQLCIFQNVSLYSILMTDSYWYLVGGITEGRGAKTAWRGSGQMALTALENKHLMISSLWWPITDQVAIWKLMNIFVSQTVNAS